MEIVIREVKGEQELKRYYDVRWEMLRKPWNQPPGSEKDGEEQNAIHLAAISNTGEMVGVIRLHFNSNEEAQARYMGVRESFQGNGIGSRLIKAAEDRAREKGRKVLVLNCRESLWPFYERRGYERIGKGPILFGELPHMKVRKTLLLPSSGGEQ